MFTCSESSRGEVVRILLVEDDVDLLDQLRTFLAQDGYEVTTSTNGGQALAILRHKTIDLIVADVQMPGMDGFSLCEHVRKNTGLARVPFIFLTAKTSREDRARGRKLGADDFIGKPFETDELLEIIRTRISRTRQIVGITEEALADRVTRSLSHELRTPLAIILGMASILESEDNLEPHTQREFLKTVRQNSLLLNKLVDNFLHVARTESGSFKIEKRPVALVPLVRSVLETFDDTLLEKSITLQARLPDDLPAIPAHKESLIVLLSNLIDNAFKFTPCGGTIEIEATNRSHFAQVSVRDTGIGVAQSNVQFVFNKFFREESDVHTNPGAGLGLTVAKRVTEAHRGSIEFESEKGKGSCVVVRLPLG